MEPCTHFADIRFELVLGHHALDRRKEIFYGFPGDVLWKKSSRGGEDWPWDSVEVGRFALEVFDIVEPGCKIVMVLDGPFDSPKRMTPLPLRLCSMLFTLGL